MKNQVLIYQLFLLGMKKKNRDTANKGIQSLINKDVLKKRQYYVNSIIDVIRFLVENELSLRGNWEKNQEQKMENL